MWITQFQITIKVKKNKKKNENWILFRIEKKEHDGNCDTYNCRKF